MKFHPACEAFPMMGDDEISALAQDIKENGQQDRILFWEDDSGEKWIVDGRHRWLACKRSGVPPLVRATTDDPIKVAISKNLHRRHMNESQRAMVAARLANLGRGGDRSKGAIAPLKTMSGAGDLLGVSRDSVKRARKVLQEGAPELAKLVTDGVVPVSRAANVIKSGSTDAFIAAIASGKTPAQASRAANRVNIRKSNAAQEIAGMYSIIYADPPWQYSNEGFSGAAEDHYPTMDTQAICDLPVADRVTDNSILFLWATNPLLEDAMRVIDAWGFSYKTNMVWVKDRAMHLGFYCYGKHELLLIATRGSMMPVDSEKPHSVIDLPRGRHSKKPDEVRSMIDRMYPDGRRLEMFARNPSDGWEVFGNEV